MTEKTFTIASAAKALGLLVSVCMDCDQGYGKPVDSGAAEGGVSHGLCDACARKREELDRERRIEWAELTGGETE